MGRRITLVVEYEKFATLRHRSIAREYLSSYRDNILATHNLKRQQALKINHTAQCKHTRPLLNGILHKISWSVEFLQQKDTGDQSARPVRTIHAAVIDDVPRSSLEKLYVVLL